MAKTTSLKFVLVFALLMFLGGQIHFADAGDYGQCMKKCCIDCLFPPSVPCVTSCAAKCALFLKIDDCNLNCEYTRCAPFEHDEKMYASCLSYCSNKVCKNPIKKINAE